MPCTVFSGYKPLDSLCDAAMKYVRSKSDRNYRLLEQAVQRFDDALAERLHERGQRAIRQAQHARHEDVLIQIPNQTLVRPETGGVWVGAWIWIPDGTK